jgi:hypothetical protein
MGWVYREQVFAFSGNALIMILLVTSLDLPLPDAYFCLTPEQENQQLLDTQIENSS